MEDKSIWYLVFIVGIVAVVGMTVMIVGAGTRTTVVNSDTAGQVFQTADAAPYDPDGSTGGGIMPVKRTWSNCKVSLHGYLDGTLERCFCGDGSGNKYVQLSLGDYYYVTPTNLQRCVNKCGGFCSSFSEVDGYQEVRINSTNTGEKYFSTCTPNLYVNGSGIFDCNCHSTYDWNSFIFMGEYTPANGQYYNTLKEYSADMDSCAQDCAEYVCQFVEYNKYVSLNSGSNTALAD